jgi:tRNA-specific 2-thiouridylase
MRQTTAVAVSGGIDSLVAAFLLKRTGRPVFGIHFVTGYEHLPAPLPQDLEKTKECRPEPHLHPLPPGHPLAAAGAVLEMEIRLADFRKPFREKIIDYFIQTYQQGETPNPCMVCNQRIKFGALLETARAAGAEQLATGHYAVCEKSGGARFQLKKGKDPDKDQSYFLAMLEQDKLAAARFPLGALTKQEVTEIAAANGLAPAQERESQDICFARGGHYLDFILQHGNFQPAPGPIVDSAGTRIGTHQGLHRYTIGQRRGINCPAAEPYYVIRLDTASNQLVVGTKADLYRGQCRLRQVNWISGKPEKPLSVRTKIRYRHRPAESMLYPAEGDRALIRFNQPQPAVTPGQVAVCYQGDAVVAGGWIDG